MPSGRYAIDIIQFTGQTWRVPNELQLGVAKVVGFTEQTSQGFFLQVP